MRDIKALVKRMDTVAIAEYTWRSIPEFQIFLKALIDATVDPALPMNRVLAVLQHRLDSLATIETTLATQYPAAAPTMQPLVKAARDALLAKIRSATKSMKRDAAAMLSKDDIQYLISATRSLGLTDPAKSFSLAAPDAAGNMVACHYLEFVGVENSTGVLPPFWVVYSRTDANNYATYSAAALHDFAMPGMFPTTVVGKCILSTVIQNLLLDAGIAYLAGTTAPKASSVSKVLKLPASALTVRSGKLVAKLQGTEVSANESAQRLSKSLSKMLSSARVVASVNYEVMPNRKQWEAVIDLSIPSLISAASREILEGFGLDSSAIELLQQLGKKE